MTTLRYNISVLDVEDPNILMDAIKCDLKRLRVTPEPIEIPTYDVGDILEVRINMKPEISIINLSADSILTANSIILSD